MNKLENYTYKDTNGASYSIIYSPNNGKLVQIRNYLSNSSIDIIAIFKVKCWKEIK